MDYDRRREFFVGDDPEMSPEVSFASKSVSSIERTADTNRITAVAVREHGTEKFAKLLRFMYTVPMALQEKLKKLIAVPKSKVCLNNTQLSGAQHQEKGLQRIRTVSECTVEIFFDVLNFGQRCAELFVFRHFRVIGTNAGLLLMSNDELRVHLGLEEKQNQTNSNKWFKILQRLCQLERLDSDNEERVSE